MESSIPVTQPPGTASTQKLWRVWGYSVVVALVLGATGWWIESIVQGESESMLANELQTVLNAEVSAVRMWLSSQESDVQAAAADEHVRDQVASIIRPADQDQSAISADPPAALLKSALAPYLSAHGSGEFVICDRAGEIVAARQEGLIGNNEFPFPADLQTGLFQQKRAAVTRPFPSVIPLQGDFQERRRGVPTMFAFAPIPDAHGQVIAALGMRIDPRREFTQILNIARAGTSGETYAFDETGLLLSPSRFDEQLQQIGLLDEDVETSSMLHVRLCDPLVDLTAGGRPIVSRDRRPLTKMAQSAVSGQAGVDVRGYRDYRGVTVVGAWTWLKEYGFGIATEIDAVEAYRSFALLRNVFRGLFALLVLSSGGILAFTLVAEYLQHKSRRDADQFARLLAEERAHALAEIRSRSEFLASLSGDIRAPLYSVFELVDLTMETDLSLQQRGYLSSALTSARALEELLNELLDLSKVEIGEMELHRETFRFRETLADVIGPLRIQARSDGKSVDSRVHAEVPDKLVGDVQRIRQVIKNIAARALELAGPAGIALVVSAGNPGDDEVELQCRITIRGDVRAGRTIQGILDDFRRAKSPDRHQSRSDLGVAVAARMLEFAGGRIWVEDADTENCSICFANRVEIGELDDHFTQRTESGLIPGLQVLLVDADEEERTQLERMLQRLQMVCTPAASADDVVPMLQTAMKQENPFGLVIIDAELPCAGGGFELCRRLRQSPQHATIPIVLMTNVELPEQISEATAAGAAAHLLKPVKPSLLEGAVVTAVLGRGRYQQLRKDLGAAEVYVRSLIPPPVEGPLRIDWRYVPATELAGDTLGFHWIDEDHCAFYVVDAAGHGIDACLLSVSILDSVKSQSLPGADFRRPDQVLAQLNRKFPMEAHGDRCFTVWYGVFDRAASTLTWAGGGHPPAMLFHGNNGSSRSVQLSSTGPMLGMLSDSRFAPQSLPVPVGSRLFVYSDGVFEVEKPDGTLWSFEEFSARLTEFSREDAPLDRMWQYVHALHGQAALDDDFTMLEVAF